MEFDSYTIALLVLRDGAPELTEAEEDALQDAHMDDLAKLHEAGKLLAAGPLLGPEGRKFRGLSVYKLGPDEARALAERNPGVLAGRYSVEVFTWMVPRGAITFSRTRFPHSRAEAQSD